MLVGCLTSQQQASVSQGRICSDFFTCCHTEIEVADQTFYLTQSQYTDTGLTSPSADPMSPGAWQGSHWSANFEVTGMTRPRKSPVVSGIRTRDLPLSRRTPTRRLYFEINDSVSTLSKCGLREDHEVNNLIQRRNSRFLQSPHCVANRLQHVHSSCPGNRVQIKCNTFSAYHVVLHATWYEGTDQLLSLTELKSHLFELFFLLAEPLTDEGGEETGVPGENPWRQDSETATYYNLRIQAPSETRTRTIALVAG